MKNLRLSRGIEQAKGICDNWRHTVTSSNVESVLIEGVGGGEGKGNFKFVPKNAERLIIRQRFPVQLCARSGRGGKINPVNTKKQNTPTTSSQNVAFP